MYGARRNYITLYIRDVIERAFEKATKVTIQNDNIKQIEDGTYIDGFYVSLTATELYQNAFAVLELVNAERKKAGVPALVMDPGLLDTAMQRSLKPRCTGAIQGRTDWIALLQTIK